jgi:hypothetical protein
MHLAVDVNEIDHCCRYGQEVPAAAFEAVPAFVALTSSEHPLLVSDALVTLVRMAGSDLTSVTKTAGVLAAAVAAMAKDGQGAAIVCNAVSLVQLLLAGARSSSGSEVSAGGGSGGDGEDGGIEVEASAAQVALVALKSHGEKDVREYAAVACGVLGI